MKRFVLFMVMAFILIAAVFANGQINKEYAEYKAKVISEIKSKLSEEANPSSSEINLNGYIYKIDDLPSVRSGMYFDFNKDGRKVRELKDDLWKVMSIYEEEVVEYNARIQIARTLIEMQKEEEYKKVLPKYFPAKFEDLTAEQKAKVINTITGGRNLYKGEWDTMVAQYHVQVGKSRAKVYEVGSGKSDIREALDWLSSQEALWYLGYVGRFTGSYEYRLKLDEIESNRRSLILYSEKNGLYK